MLRSSFVKPGLSGIGDRLQHIFDCVRAVTDGEDSNRPSFIVELYLGEQISKRGLTVGVRTVCEYDNSGDVPRLRSIQERLEIGRASCRERAQIEVVAGEYKNKG